MIVSFSPFRAVEEHAIFTFKCKCGSDSCIKLDELDKNVFWSGNYMCSVCGKTIVNGEELNYYHDCFIRHDKKPAQQLTLDF